MEWTKPYFKKTTLPRQLRRLKREAIPTKMLYEEKKRKTHETCMRHNTKMPTYSELVPLAQKDQVPEKESTVEIIEEQNCSTKEDTINNEISAHTKLDQNGCISNELLLEEKRNLEKENR
ncbi:uncharacterized protein, partial [Mycetomoellerius zeteki]|uniref:uncharacterized protein n=1 Tax=Mycetomoellerius zeteki TaxID=64791 RepID=UPI00084E778B